METDTSSQNEIVTNLMFKYYGSRTYEKRNGEQTPTEICSVDLFEL
jgi:hypothetical protein